MKQHKANITKSITLLSIVPLLVLGTVIAIVTTGVIFFSLKDQVGKSLGVLVHSSYDIYELKYPGEYEIKGNEIYKGGHSLKNEFSFVDRIKTLSDADATLFFGNKRYLTTIRGSDGERAVGTVCEDKVKQEVLDNGNEYFSSDVLVNNKVYFGYYVPLNNCDGKTIGMLFVGKPHDDVMKNINRNIYFILITVFGVLTITFLVSNHYGKKIIIDLKDTKKFLETVAKGNLEATIEPELIERQDEIGEMGRFAVMLRDSITDMVGKDPLTGLHNRRSGMITLENLENLYHDENKPYSIAMADIDFFKQINDTYSHMVGDEVLKIVSDNIFEFTKAYGNAFRWGGEEFLLVFKNMDKDSAYEALKNFTQNVVIEGVDNIAEYVPLTLTFGVADCTEVEDISKLLQLADKRLYDGKDKGRNCVIKD